MNKLKFGLVGHKSRIKQIESVIQEFFPEIETTDIEFINYLQIDSTVAYLYEQEKDLDGLIFTSKVPYEIINHAMYSKIPWIYIDHNYDTLHRILLTSTFNHEFDMLNISIDSYDPTTVEYAYSELGIQKGHYIAHVAEFDYFDNQYLENLRDYHSRRYREDNVSFCITCISSIYEWLLEEGIPCMLLYPTANTIKQSVYNLKIKTRSQIHKESQIIVIFVEIDLPSEYNLLNENEYQLMLEKTKVTQEVYLYAQKIQAAVVEIGARNYLLFSTRFIFENTSNNLQQLPLLNAITSNTLSTLSMGIGYGTTAREAKHNATRGMQRAKKRGGNQAFIVTNKQFKGPITPQVITQDEKPVINSVYQQISEKTGISINTLYKLHCIVDQNQKNIFTPKELSDEFGNLHRNMNRILEKLEIAGYLEVSGKKIITGAGRPSRIVKLLF
jgi:hypothetical protein